MPKISFRKQFSPGHQQSCSPNTDSATTCRVSQMALGELWIYTERSATHLMSFLPHSMQNVKTLPRCKKGNIINSQGHLQQVNGRLIVNVNEFVPGLKTNNDVFGFKMAQNDVFFHVFNLNMLSNHVLFHVFGFKAVQNHVFFSCFWFQNGSNTRAFPRFWRPSGSIPRVFRRFCFHNDSKQGVFPRIWLQMASVCPLDLSIKGSCPSAVLSTQVIHAIWPGRLQGSIPKRLFWPGAAWGFRRLHSFAASSSPGASGAFIVFQPPVAWNKKGGFGTHTRVPFRMEP